MTEEITFGDLIDRGILDITDGYRAQNSELGGNGLIFLRAGHVTDSHIDFTGVDRFHDELTPRLKEKISQPNDVAVTTKGNSTGRIAFVTATMPPFVYSPHLSRWRSLDRDQLEPGFLRYWSSGREFATQLRGMSASTDMAPYLSLRDQRRLKLTLPHIDSQRAIANVLGALDDKIEQNRMTAHALERLARAIFQAWFVDFEPVKAKAAGATAFPSVPQPVFDALPTRLVDSAIGPVPERWALEAIGDVVTTKGGGTPSTRNADYWDGGEHFWATPKDMSRLAHPVLLDTERRITDAGVNNISSGILPVGTVLMSSRAPVGYLAIAGVPTAINQGFIAMVCDGPLPPTYVLNWAFASMDTIKANASGTTFPEISKGNFRPLPVVVPTPDVIVAYRLAADPIYELISAAVSESDRLALLRDYFLPRLLSGAVRVNL
ncbi:MAG: restriction endonuclease subunit S [Burkholderiales bacterium]